MRKSKEGKNFSTSNKEIKVSRIFEGEQNWELQKWKNNDINCDYSAIITLAKVSCLDFL